MIDDTADADLLLPVQPGERPDEISINGRTFDSDDTAVGIAVGWRANNWLAFELGYTDFGEAEESLRFPSLGFPVPSVNFRPDPIFDPGDVAGVAPIAAFPIDGPTLGIEQWSLSAKMSHSLVSRLFANWSLGVTYAGFDAGGQWTINEIESFNPLVINRISTPFASPDDEIGYTFGFGFGWTFNDRFAADIGYKRHDTQVLDVETVSLALVLSL